MTADSDDSLTGYEGFTGCSPVMNMKKDLRMNIYNATTGAQMTILWANEEQYLLGKKFLMDMGAVFAESSGNTPEFYGLESKQQLEALYEFRKSLREKGPP